MNGCNRAVAVVPKAAYQDAQADTLFNDYTNIAVRIVEGEGPCSRPEAKGGAPGLRCEQLCLNGVVGVQFVQAHQVSVRTYQRV